METKSSKRTREENKFLAGVDLNSCTIIPVCSYHFVIAVWRGNEARCVPVKDWELIADNLKEAGWSLGWVSTLDLEGRTIWIVDAHG